VLQKDKLIESLRLELAEAQIKLVESENQGGGRLQEVERLLMDARMANARLMEDNESYQLLLQDKTLKGDFGTSDFSYMNNASNKDALAALEGKTGNSLMDELSEVGGVEGEESDNYRRLEAELRTAKDQNKALTLYINKIIERLLRHQDFEHILDQGSDAKPNTNKELPPPPGSGLSLLQRAKSMAVNAATAAANATAGVAQAAPTTMTAMPPKNSRPRPLSFMPSVPTNTAHNNPETAPSIPIGLGRSTSVRRGRPMSEQFVGASAAAALKATGGEAGSSGLSPPNRQSGSFQPPVSGGRIPSGGMSANFPGMRSETSSVSGESVSGATTPPPSMSPPRGTAGGDGDKPSTTFAGNKPRPLRLIQENPDMARAAAADAANKRASWIGWASSLVKKEDISPGMGSPGY
jgi:hypothetical protein